MAMIDKGSRGYAYTCDGCGVTRTWDYQEQEGVQASFGKSDVTLCPKCASAVLRRIADRETVASCVAEQASEDLASERTMMTAKAAKLREEAEALERQAA